MPIANMPADLAAVYDQLWQEVVWVHSKWQLFLQMYDDQEAVALLNDTAPAFFRVCQDALIDDVLLALCRLTDPAQTGSKSNLSLRRLIESIDELALPDLRQQVRDAFAAAAAARDHRNRRIAHADLPTRMNAHPVPLSQVTKRDMDRALQAVEGIMNSIEGYFSDSETAYTAPVLAGDGEALLYWLRKGHDNRRRRDNQPAA